MCPLHAAPLPLVAASPASTQVREPPPSFLPPSKPPYFNTSYFKTSLLQNLPPSKPPCFKTSLLQNLPISKPPYVKTSLFQNLPPSTSFIALTLQGGLASNLHAPYQSPPLPFPLSLSTSALDPSCLNPSSVPFSQPLPDPPQPISTHLHHARERLFEPLSSLHSHPSSNWVYDHPPPLCLLCFSVQNRMPCNNPIDHSMETACDSSWGILQAT